MIGRHPTLFALALLLGGGTIAGGVVSWTAALRLPHDAFAARSVASVRLLDRRGVLLRDAGTRPDGRAHWVGLADISPHVIAATLAGEDHRFFAHAGVDPLAIGRALVLDLGRGRIVSGASTLTMQLVRLVDRPRSRSLVNKLRQAVLAYELERVISKRAILAQYLNRAPYGQGTFGVEAAAQRYFDKPAARLSLAEAAALAALPRGPTAYDPFRHGPRRLIERQRHLLALMRARGLIDAEQHRLAARQPLQLAARRTAFAAPHFVERLLSLRDASAPDAIELRSTLDLQLQREVEHAVRQTVTRLADHQVTNAAALVVDNRTGEVLAYVGSADFDDAEHAGQIDGAQALRQPGSTLKPFTYALALERGKTPASLLRDLPAHFSTERGDYHPHNYDRAYHGPVRLRVALASSYNVPAVRVAAHVGVERLLDRLRALGISSLWRGARHYGLGVTLGNGEVTLEQLVGAYAALARGGSYRPLRMIRRVRRADGSVGRPPSPAPRRIFARDVSYLVTSILADPIARLPAFGRETPLDVGFAAAVKTGTSKDFRDNWTIGFTPDLTVGVWVGNFDATPMRRVSGISGAGPLWAEVITAAVRRHGELGHAFARPTGLTTAAICPLSGALPGPHCPQAIDELFRVGHAPRVHCRFHQQVAVDRRNGLRAGPACAPAQVEQREVVVYPPAYRAWATRHGHAAPPLGESPLCRGAARARATGLAAIRVRFPVDGDHFFVDPDLRAPHQRVPLEATVQGFAEAIDWLVDGEQVSRAPYPYTASWPIRRGRHTVQARLPGGQRSRPIRITVR